MAVVILGRRSTSIFWDGVQKKNEKILQAIDNQNLFGIFPHDMVVRNSPGGRIIFDGLDKVSIYLRMENPKASRTVFKSEHSSVKTVCLSWHVVIYVMAFTPCTGSTPLVCQLK